MESYKINIVQVRNYCEDRFSETFQPIANDIESLGRPGLRGEGDSTTHLNKVTEVLVKRDSLTFVSANLLRNQLKGLSDLDDGWVNGGHILGSCVIKDFSATGAARTFAINIPKVIRNEFFIGSSWDRDNGYSYRYLTKSVMSPFQR